MEHVYRQRVYYSDTDAGGIMYHGRYLDFAEHARTEFVREISSAEGEDSTYLDASSVGFVVKHIEVDYHTPAFLDDLLVVKSSVVSLKRFSITLKQKIFRDDQEIACVLVKAAAVDLQNYSVKPLEPRFSKRLGEYMDS